MHFSERLRGLLEEQNLTQKQLAEELGIPASTLGGYVQGTSEPDFDTLKLIAGRFKVTTDYLLDHYTDQVRSAEEAELRRIFRALTPEQQKLYLEQGRAFLKIR